MNEEIKKIKHRLELLHAECNPKAREEDINNTLDYITNLQQENERLNTCIDDQERVINSLMDKKDLYKIKYNDYKSRCEKAIEYLEHFNSDEICENITGIANILLNILQNGSDE